MDAILRDDIDGVLRVQLTEDPEGPVLAIDEMSQGARWSVSLLLNSGKETCLHENASLPEALRLFAHELDGYGVK